MLAQSRSRAQSVLAMFVALLMIAPSAAVSYGCFSSLPSEFTNVGNSTYMSSGACAKLCPGSTVYALQGYSCWCANVVPNSADSSDSCTNTCPGWSDDYCGGNNAFNVYVTGSYSTAAAVSKSSSSTSKSGSSSSTTQSGSSSTVVSSSTTESSTSDSSRSSNSASHTAATSASSSGTVSSATSSATSSGAASSSRSSGGISGGAIAGIVVGVVVGVSAIAALAFFLWRRRRDQDDDDGYYSPEASAKKFPEPFGGSGGGLGPPAAAEKDGAFNPYPVIDQRLNPEMLNHRISFASLTDARDYSRQILHVANPE